MKQETKYTDGPWIVEPSGTVNRVFYVLAKKDRDWSPIVSTWAGNKRATRANANLISAAPDMVREMEALAEALEDTGHEPPQSYYDAIKKARGWSC